MAEIQFGLMMRAPFPPGDDMRKRFGELVEQARLADRPGYASITKGMHYSAAPWRDLQQFPFLSRIMAEAPSMRLDFGLVLLSLHKPLDIAEQIATVDVMKPRSDQETLDRRRGGHGRLARSMTERVSSTPSVKSMPP